MSEKWTAVWPRKPGVYLFYGYAINNQVEPLARLHLVTVEYVSEIFGVQYRTSRYTIKKETGAFGMWMKVLSPSLPGIDEEAASRAVRYPKDIKELRFVE
ncbi:MAG: hypothetical protein ACYSW8_30585 [Planctomycetota bacterium]|jgi:hypothetical protein